MADKEYIERGALLMTPPFTKFGGDLTWYTEGYLDCAWSRMIVVNGKPEYYCQCWNPGNVIHVDARGFCMCGERKEQT